MQQLSLCHLIHSKVIKSPFRCFAQYRVECKLLVQVELTYNSNADNAGFLAAVLETTAGGGSTILGSGPAGTLPPDHSTKPVNFLKMLWKNIRINCTGQYIWYTPAQMYRPPPTGYKNGWQRKPWKWVSHQKLAESCGWKKGQRLPGTQISNNFYLDKISDSWRAGNADFTKTRKIVPQIIWWTPYSILRVWLETK